MVAVPTHWKRDRLDTGRFEILCKRSLDMITSSRARLSMSSATPIKEEIASVGGSDHVEVDVKREAVKVLFLQCADEVLGPFQPDLFGCPPGEADGVLRFELCQLDSEFEDCRTS